MQVKRLNKVVCAPSWSLINFKFDMNILQVEVELNFNFNLRSDLRKLRENTLEHEPW